MFPFPSLETLIVSSGPTTMLRVPPEDEHGVPADAGGAATTAITTSRRSIAPPHQACLELRRPRFPCWLTGVSWFAFNRFGGFLLASICPRRPGWPRGSPRYSTLPPTSVPPFGRRYRHTLGTPAEHAPGHIPSFFRVRRRDREGCRMKLGQDGRQVHASLLPMMDTQDTSRAGPKPLLLVAPSPDISPRTCGRGSGDVWVAAESRRESWT